MTLAEYIQHHLSMPFAWGINDCVTFAAGWVKISTGKDHLAEFDAWTNKRQAKLVLKKNGGLKLIVDRRLAIIRPNYAEDGDIALHQNSLRLYSGPHILGPGENGLVLFNRMEAVCAWHCG